MRNEIGTHNDHEGVIPCGGESAQQSLEPENDRQCRKKLSVIKRAAKNKK